MTDNTFAPSGLLGRTYSQRQKAQRDREASNNKPILPTGPFTDGPSLLNNPNPTRTSLEISSTSSTSAHLPRRNNTHKRHSSADLRPPGAPKPLIDLTPTYVPPPQHARKGRAFRPAPDLAATGLVDAATSPENAFPAAPGAGSDWRAAALARARSNAAPRGQGVPMSAQALHGQENPHAAERSADAFTGKGLLATAAAGMGQGGEGTGRGVMDGSRAKGPMVDLGSGRVFAGGSLLESVERREGRSGPVIERGERGKEVEVGTGEGV